MGHMIKLEKLKEPTNNALATTDEEH